MALYLKLMLHFNVQVLPLKPNATQHWLDLINDWDSLLCEARHVAVAINVSPEFHSRTRTEVTYETFQSDVFDVTLNNIIIYAADHKITDNWEHL